MGIEVSRGKTPTIVYYECAPVSNKCCTICDCRTVFGSNPSDNKYTYVGSYACTKCEFFGGRVVGSKIIKCKHPYRKI